MRSVIFFFSIKVYASAKDTQLACGVYADKTKTVIQDVRKITRKMAIHKIKINILKIY